MSSRTSVEVLPVERSDLARCSEIMHLAFDGDPVMSSLYPPHLAQPYSKEERFRIRGKGMEKQHFNNPGKVMLKAVDRESREILGVAIWAKPGTPIKLPTEEEEEKGEDDEKDLEFYPQAGFNMAMAMSTKRREVFKDQPHWYLSFLFIDPKAQGKGVGSALLSWGLEQADKANPPLPVVLESSPVGRPIYEKKGFKLVDTILLKDIAEFPFMVRPAKGS